MSERSSTRAQATTIRERYDPRIPALVHPEWEAAFPWLTQGTTVRGDAGFAFDLGLFSGSETDETVGERWKALLERTGMTAAVHARQPHGCEVRSHASGPEGVRIVEGCDGHSTDEPGLLLAVATADCVPVFIVAPDARAVAVIHAGWRGAAAGVLERGLAVMAERYEAPAELLSVHMGPAICGDCYEVGPEVFEALSRPVPEVAKPIDLRAVLADRAVAGGVPEWRISVSEHCTRCTGSGLFSHRAGDRGRQVGYLGIRS